MDSLGKSQCIEVPATSGMLDAIALGLLLPYRIERVQFLQSLLLYVLLSLLLLGGLCKENSLHMHKSKGRWHNKPLGKPGPRELSGPNVRSSCHL